jgi:hypothetical protein
LQEEFIKQLLDQKMQNEAFQKLLLTYQKTLYNHIRNIILNHDDTNDDTHLLRSLKIKEKANCFLDVSHCDK